MGIMRAPELAYLTINFDSNITKVVYSQPYGDNTWVVSETQTINATYGTFTITLKDNYVIDTVTTTNGEITNITDTTFEGRNLFSGTTITITSKLVATRLSYDLTKSVTNWANLTDGEHTIQIVAKGTGYRNSALSSAVTFTKGTVTSGETWVLNETLTDNVMNYAGTYDINFKSNNYDYTYIILSSIKGTTNVQYNNEEVYAGYLGGWYNNNNYRTITFDTAPTGALLTWLQNNGTKQNGGG